MFKITPIQDKSEQIEICKLCSAQYRENCFGYKMFDMETGEIMGISQFEISKHGYIYDLRPRNNLEDYEAMFILGRQTMNFIDTCGAHTCYASMDAGNPKLLSAIGFKEVEGQLFADMTGMFDGNCKNH